VRFAGVEGRIVPPNKMTRSDVAELDLLGEGHLQQPWNTSPCHHALHKTYFTQHTTIERLCSTFHILVYLCRLDSVTNITTKNIKSPSTKGTTQRAQSTPHRSSLSFYQHIIYSA